MHNSLTRLAWGAAVWSALGSASTIAQAPDPLADLKLHESITLTAGLAVPTEVGAVSQGGLPTGVKLAFENLPRGIEARPAALRAEGGRLYVPFTAAPGTSPGPHVVVAKWTRHAIRKEQSVSISVDPFDPYAAIDKCVRFSVPSGQPARIIAGTPAAFRVDAANWNFQPLATVPNSANGGARDRVLLGYVYPYLERVGADPTIPAEVFQGIVNVAGTRQGSRYSCGGLPLAANKPQVPPGRFESIALSPEVIRRLSPGKYRLEYRFRPRVPEGHASPEKAAGDAILFEVVGR